MGTKFSAPTPSEPSQQYGHSKYGGLPVEFVQSSLEDELLKFLQEDSIFATEEEDALTTLGYDKAVDYPDVEQHKYYEGYFYARPCGDNGDFTDAPLQSMHPRYGYDFPKPSAPLRLASFIEALRRVNAQWTEYVKAELSKLDSSNKAAKAVLKMFSENRHFADIASQIHFGDEISCERAQFHNDGHNSLLHLALSINGRRTLLYKTTSKLDVLDRVSVYAEDPDEYKTNTSTQRAGSVYVSSPLIVSHAVGYPPCDWENRVVAVQCRCLFQVEEIYEMCHYSSEHWKETMCVISSSLSSACAESISCGTDERRVKLRLPTYLEVKEVFDELSARKFETEK